MCSLNEYDAMNLNAPSVEAYGDGLCAICHMRPATNRHHIVPRSHGGTDGPTIAVCGNGNASGCHALLHAGRIYLRYRHGAWWFICPSPPCKIEQAWNMSGWKKIKQDKPVEQTYGRKA